MPHHSPAVRWIFENELSMSTVWILLDALRPIS